MTDKMSKFVEEIYHSPVFGRVFHTQVYCLKRELRDCKSVLDLGCGPSSPIKYCQNIQYSVGVEAFTPYLEESERRKIHTRYLNQRIEEVNFPPKSFDAVIMIEVLEHLSKKEGLKLLKKVEKWAKKKVVVTTPNGYFPVEEVDGNILERHLSGWTVQDFKNLEYNCFGLAGVRYLYLGQNKVTSLLYSDLSSILKNIRFKPKIIFYVINSLLQIFSYFFPVLSFELLAIKDID